MKNFHNEGRRLLDGTVQNVVIRGRPSAWDLFIPVLRHVIMYLVGLRLLKLSRFVQRGNHFRFLPF